jgi:membrane-associated phospholipid phosphatase
MQRARLVDLALIAALVLGSSRAAAQAEPSSPQPSASPQPLASEAAVHDAPARDDTHRLHWRWRRWGALDYAITGVLAAGYLAVEFGAGPPDEGRWRGGILFDGAVRRALVKKSRKGRDDWNSASDVFALIPQGMMLIDSLLVPLLSDDFDTEVAWQLTVIAAQSEAITGLLARSGHYGIARERPDVVPCQRDPEYGYGCFRGSTASFPGGHVASAFVGAGVVCAAHLKLPLYGGGFWDPAACIANTAVAATAGYARMAAGRHYLSDTVVGAALGASAGFLLPWFVHFRGGESAQEDHSSLRWTISSVDTGDAPGLGVLGWF